MINGITYDLQLNTAKNDSHRAWALMGKQDTVTSGCNITRDSSKIYISAGYFLARGRQTQITGTQEITIPTVASGTAYCKLVYTIDLTQTNTTTSFLQGEFEVLQSAGDYPAITREDLDGTGTTYQMEFARFTITSSGIATFEDSAPRIWKYATFTAGNWTLTSGSYQQTVRVSGITSDSNPAFDFYTTTTTTEDIVSEIDSYNNVFALETGNDTVTLKAYAEPLTTFAIKIRGI